VEGFSRWVFRLLTHPWGARLFHTWSSQRVRFGLLDDRQIEGLSSLLWPSLIFLLPSYGCLLCKSANVTCVSFEEDEKANIALKLLVNSNFCNHGDEEHTSLL
uniref:Uncharacterized protein n=1 Tax=Oryzias latipes TaxID=8090 RepID=A0A3B3HA78_ORYLA